MTHRISGSVRKQRRVSAWLVFVLLFSQFITLAYACPGDRMETSARAMPEMPGCDGNMSAAELDPGSPLLCKASCERPDQHSGQGAKVASIDLPLSLGLLVAAVSASPALEALGSVFFVLTGRSPPGWPPLYLLHLSLRN